MKVHLETMGCQMNVLDSELVAAALAAAGMELTGEPREADVLLYNTCSVRQHAENKVHSRLGWACQRKASGVRVIVGVLGCMAQRLGEELLKQYAGLDIVCSPNRLGELPELIRAALVSGPQLALDPDRRDGNSPRREAGVDVAGTGGVEVDKPTPGFRRGPSTEPNAPSIDELDLSRDPSRTPLPAQAYVRIIRGCDKFCTYCVVPYVRGPEVSRDPAAIVEEVRRLVDAGVTQVTLLGQAVNSYRWEKKGSGTFSAADGTGGRAGGIHEKVPDPIFSLADLLARLDAIAGLRRLRFVTSYPAGFDQAILEAMRDLPTVCEYLHVPAQSGSDRILHAMNRSYSRAEYDELIDRARATVPGIAIAGDFIVGFPGETDDDHTASADLIRRSRYKNCYVFKYSPRPGTTADRRLADDVPVEVKRRRNNELLAVQEEVSLADNRAFVGQTVEVLVEGLSPRAARQPKPAPPGQTQLVGRTRTDHIVVFDGPLSLAGQYVNVTITDATALTLIGRALVDA